MRSPHGCIEIGGEGEVRGPAPFPFSSFLLASSLYITVNKETKNGLPAAWKANLRHIDNFQAISVKPHGKPMQAQIRKAAWGANAGTILC